MLKHTTAGTFPYRYNIRRMTLYARSTPSSPLLRVRYCIRIEYGTCVICETDDIDLDDSVQHNSNIIL